MKEIKLPWQVFDLLAQTNDIYQLRLLQWAFVKAQSTLQHVDKNLQRINLQLVRDVCEIEIPLSFLTTDQAHASDHIRRAFELQNVDFLATYEGRPIQIKAIAFPRLVRKSEGMAVRYYIHKSLWLALIDFSHGYRRLNISVLSKIRRPTTILLYFLISSQNQDITLKLDTFRNMLRLPKAYTKKSNLIARVLEPARYELATAQTTLAYKFDSNTKGKTPNTITLQPIPQQPERSEGAEQLADRLQINMHTEVADYIRNKFNASDADLRTIAPHLDTTQTPFAQIDTIAQIHTNALRNGARNPIAYLIAALKRQC